MIKGYTTLLSMNNANLNSVFGIGSSHSSGSCESNISPDVLGIIAYSNL